MIFCITKTTLILLNCWGFRCNWHRQLCIPYLTVNCPTWTELSPLRLLRDGMFDGSPGLLRWRCCHGGGFPLQYVRACFIAYHDVYITIGVYIFSRKIFCSCIVVFLRMSVSFNIYLVRDDLINKRNQAIPWKGLNIFVGVEAKDVQRNNCQI